MSTAVSSSRFFGLNLRTLWPEIRRSWFDLHQTSVLAWLTPDFPVRVLHAAGHETTWLGGQLIQGAESKAGRFDAIELPEEILLHRTLHMPVMSQAQIAQAVELDLRSASPFTAVDMVWGYSAQPEAAGGLHIDAVLISRKQAAQYIGTQQHRLAITTAEAPEVWAFTPKGLPIVLVGWGEVRRAQYGAARRHMAYGLLATALCLVVAMAITPTMQLRLRAIEATHAYEAVQARTTALLGQREAFIRSNEEMESLRSLLAEHVDFMPLFEAITQSLPDDTSLQSLQIQGLKVTINGLTANAATLMQLLGARNGFKDVRAPSAATRNPGATAENFIIEFQLDPTVFSIAATPADTIALTATTPAAPAVDAVSAPPKHKSRFSSGPESTVSHPEPGDAMAVRKTAP